MQSMWAMEKQTSDRRRRALNRRVQRRDDEKEVNVTMYTPKKGRET